MMMMMMMRWSTWLRTISKKTLGITWMPTHQGPPELLAVESSIVSFLLLLLLLFNFFLIFFKVYFV